MRSSHLYGRTLAASLIACGVGLVVVGTASADPNDAAQPDPPAPAPAANAASSSGQVSDDADPAALDACKQFRTAMDYAASNYEDFAYDSAGGGNSVDYGNPLVATDNVTGRTALRQAAAAAMQASATPGLAPDIAAPMQSWSLQATKLVVVMGLRGGGDTLNTTASDMNRDGHDAQLACAAAGAHP
ncbi:MAG: hypothetical protein JO044_04750 [Mycobacteriaceae bacterium]|nr:hypothetical protein [Mycobacteriaceae bacterium]